MSGTHNFLYVQAAKVLKNIDIDMCVFLPLCLVTCSEVISQQAEDPFSENTGGEQVVTVVIHCELGFHLRGEKHM